LSYVVHVWETPLPASVAQASELCARLQREATAPNPKYLDLASRLTARFPDIDSLDEDDPGVWTDGPLARNASAAVFAIGVQVHALGEVMPVLFEAAKALGLLVYDDQAATVHLPDGQVLGPERAASARSAPPAPVALGRAEVKQAVGAALGPLLTAHGFKPHQGAGFRLTADSARFDVKIDIEPSGSGHRLGVATLLTIADREDRPLLRRYYPGGTDFCLHHARIAVARGLVWPDLEAHIDCATRVETHAQLDRVTLGWARLFEQAILPLVQRCLTLQGLADEMIGNMSAFSQRPFTLVLAAQVGRHDLDDVAKRLSEWLPPHIRPQLESLLSELRAAVGMPALGS
jgi:hypothetical protein